MPIHRIAAAILAAVLILAGLALWPVLLPAAHAQQPPSKCGAFATGTRADGSTWTGAAPRMWVDRQGRWQVCQPWVPDGGDPEMKEPPKKEPCLERKNAYEEWYDGEAMCSARPPGVYSGQSFIEDSRVRGELQSLRDEWGQHQGVIVLKCEGGTWRVIASSCSAVW